MEVKPSELVFDVLVEFNGHRETRVNTTLTAINAMLEDTERYVILRISVKPYTHSTLSSMIRDCGGSLD